ncbi:uncharacterized protein LJ206_008263 [Theristicus caerulescens]
MCKKFKSVSSIPHVSNLSSILKSGDWCSPSLRQYACASVTKLTSRQLSSILTCYITDPTALLDQGAFLLLFQQVNSEVLQTALNEISVQVRSDQIPSTTKAFILNAAWEVVKSDPKVANAGFLASWFQETLHAYLPSIGTSILDCMAQLPVSCDGLATVVQALDTAYSEMDNSMRQLFTALEVLTASQLAQLTVLSNVFSNSSLAAAITQVLSTNNVLYLEDYLTELSTLPLTPPLDHNAMYSMLETILTKVRENFPDLCSPSLKDLFQVKLKRMLAVTDANILRLFPRKIGCTDFQDIYKGLNSVHHELDPDTQRTVYQARMDFLNGQAAKEGVACTFTTSNSRDWLEDNFGFSSIYTDYSDFLRLNPSFNGFEVTDLLTSVQLGKLLITSRILTENTRASAETDVTEIMKTFQTRNVSELHTFLHEVNSLAAQMHMESITSTGVRDIMLKGIFQILKPHFASMTRTDLKSLFNGTLTLYLGSITHNELMTLPAISDCPLLQVVVRGLDYAFDDMTTETKTDITQWIVQTLPRLDCQMDENWMTLNFRRFRSIANITDFAAAYKNFTGMALLEELTAIQLAQLTLSQDVFSSVANIERIFDRLTEVPGLHELAAYWDELNSALEKPFANTFNISMEVKRIMLTRTVQQLCSALPTFTDDDYHLWFQKRLMAVLPGIHATILQDIPKTMSCSSYKSLITGINTVFSEIPTAGKMDVYNYIVAFLSQQSELTGPACSTQVTTRDWLLQFFGKFCTEAPYTQLVSLYHQPFDAYAILDILTPTQIGDMMVYSDTLTRVDAAVQLVQFFQQSEAEDVQMILTQFTKAARMRKITVLPNDDIARLLLLQYLTSMSEQMKTYTAADWNITFQNELYFLSPVINESTLTFVVLQDYDSLVAVVTALDNTYGYMTESSRRDVALWIARNLQILKDGPTESTTEWIQVTWKSFFHNIALQEVIATINNIDLAKILDVLSIEQLVEYGLTSDALVNVTTMQDVLNALRGENPQIPEPKMSEFLMKFNLALTQEGIVGIRNDEVRTEMLTTLFMDLSKHFYKFADLDYEFWFLENLRFLLPSINTDLLELIPGDLSFPAYTAIVRGLDNVFPELPQNTSHAIYLFIKRILESQLTFSENVFPGMYDSSRSFLELIFYRFLHFAPYSDFTDFYKDFNGYEVLDLLSARQIGEMTVLTNAFKRERLTVQILLEMEKRSFEELTEFIKALNAAADERDLTILPDPRIRELLFDLLFKSLPLSTFTANEYAFWFGSELQLFLPAMNANYLQLLPLDIDCQSHQNLVQAMDRVYERYTDDQRLSIYHRIHNFLETYRNTQGVTCSPNANSSTWIAANYGYFSAHATLHEFSSLNPNFNGMSALEKLSPAQLAQLTLETGALADETSVITIMDNLHTPSDLAKFFATLNDMASVELQNSNLADVLLSSALHKIGPSFPKMKAGGFADWFQDTLQNVLHAVNEMIVAEIPVNISCDSYQQMLKGFNKIYTGIPTENIPHVFGFCKTFLTSKVKSGVACGSATQSTQNWLEVNLGNFSKYAEYQDLVTWNKHFVGMDVLDKLSPPQLASLTLLSDAINEEEEMCQILAKLHNKPSEEIYEYLDQFNREAAQLAITTIKNNDVRKKMLTQFTGDLEAEFPAFSPAEWTRLLARLTLLLPSAGKEDIKLFLSHISGCDSFRALVSSLSQAYMSLLPMNQQGICSTLLTFLESQHTMTGSACAFGQETSLDWLQKNLGAFAANASYEDFTRLMTDFSGFSVRDNLTITQLAHVFFDPGVLDDTSMVETLLVSLESRPALDISAFVDEFVATASQQGLPSLANVQVRDAMFSAIFCKLRGQFPTFSASQYKDWFQNKLSLWVGSINASALAAIPRNIPCRIYQIIMSSLESSFQQMSPASHQDVYSFAKSYLSAKASQGGGPCTENTRGSLGWLQTNLGSFSSLATYRDLTDMNADFSIVDAVAGLSPEQLAAYTLASDVLRDMDKAGKVFSSLSSRTIGDFMDAFNAAAKQHNVSQLPHGDVRQFILGQIFCHLSTVFELFSTEDYGAWFGGRLGLFLSSLNAQNLGFLPSDMTCGSLAAIVKILNERKAQVPYENPEHIYSFIKRVLHFQLQNSGSACTQGTATDREWLLQYFGLFTSFGSYSDFATLKSNFHGHDSLDLFSAEALAQLTVQSKTIYSPSAIQVVLDVIGNKKEPLQYLSAFLEDFNTFVLKSSDFLGSTKVRETMLMMSAEIIFPQITDMSLEDTATWLHRLRILLPHVNATMLELLPLSMPCPYYQAFIAAIDGVYPVLSARKKHNVYEFQKAYLTAQFTDSGSACQDGTTGTKDWLQKNLGEICSVAKLSELQTFYPDIAGVSFTSLCTEQQ